MSECVTRFKVNCPSSLSAPGTGATAERYLQCATDVKTASCEDVAGRSPPESCRTVAGTLEDGAVCGHDSQCKGRLCRKTSGNACGACSTLGSAGAPCEGDDECDDGLKCHQKKCIAYGKAGDPCSASQPCLPTLGCNEGRCAPPLGPGAPCKYVPNENPCDFSQLYYCHPKDGVCAKVELAPPGGACEVSLEKITGCSAGSTCRIPGDSSLGQGTCEAAAADGAPCDDEKGPRCLSPARCIAGVCTIVDAATCK